MVCEVAVNLFLRNLLILEAIFKYKNFSSRILLYLQYKCSNPFRTATKLGNNMCINHEYTVQTCNKYIFETILLYDK